MGKIKIYLYLILFVCSVSAGIFFGKPFYEDYQVKQKMLKLAPFLDAMQQHFAYYANVYGYIPNNREIELQDNFQIYNKDKIYAYDINSLPDSKIKADLPMGQVAVIQGQINGLELGLAPAEGGMFTCIMANRNQQIESKCFYQVTKM